MGQPSKVILCPTPRPDAALRLFCFPYAGVGASIYYPWAHLLPPEIELWTVQLAGRENRLREVTHCHMEQILAEMEREITPLLHKPFAFFGHSFGALIAFALTRRLRRRTQLAPRHLFFSARRAPQLPDPLPPIHGLTEQAFVAAIHARYKGIPAAIAQEPELMALFLPILRADFAVMETYTYTDEPSLDCPISVYGGDEDHSINHSDLCAWQQQTSRAFTHFMFPGGHFFLQHHRMALVQTITQTLCARK